MQHDAILGMHAVFCLVKYNGVLCKMTEGGVQS